jgi:hypothetical protein
MLSFIKTKEIIRLLRLYKKLIIKARETDGQIHFQNMILNLIDKVDV